MARAGIALGSNLGDRLANLRAAFRELERVSGMNGRVLAAPVYQTVPRFCPEGSPDFLNTVVEIGCDGGACGLLDQLLEIELRLGRVRSAGRNASRVIDLDLLYCGSEVCDSARLTLPHPRIGERRFVLQPLADIRGDLVLPGQDASVEELLAGLVTDEPPLERVGLL
ncbi:MAG: 2-amino-4-hydroxy-6-hydroxymethyldihydropteridine diphosphokinase [Verrucomicrobiota bacterium JB025]|nr:2-amino-4-hydroxy-6-hydroxymethyldihydropteridine diphosphokinase [Verrucomicrobiota bacterium JB025]